VPGARFAVVKARVLACETSDQKTGQQQNMDVSKHNCLFHWAYFRHRFVYQVLFLPLRGGIRTGAPHQYHTGTTPAKRQ